MAQGKISLSGLNTTPDNPPTPTPDSRKSMLRLPGTSSWLSLPCDGLNPYSLALAYGPGRVAPPSPFSPSLLLAFSLWGGGGEDPKSLKKKKKCLNHNLIHNLQAIQPVILVPLDHFLFFLFFPLPHLCLSSSVFWWFYFFCYFCFVF